MTLPTAKREKLADQLTWLANRQSLGLPEIGAMSASLRATDTRS